MKAHPVPTASRTGVRVHASLRGGASAPIPPRHRWVGTLPLAALSVLGVVLLFAFLANPVSAEETPADPVETTSLPAEETTPPADTSDTPLPPTTDPVTTTPEPTTTPPPTTTAPTTTEPPGNPTCEAPEPSTSSPGTTPAPGASEPTTTDPPAPTDATSTAPPSTPPTSTEPTATDPCAPSTDSPTHSPPPPPSQEATGPEPEVPSAGTGGPPVLHRPPVGSSRPNPVGSGQREGGPGSYDGAEAPVFGVLEGLDLSPHSGDSDIVREVFLQTADSVSPAEELPTLLGTPVLLAALFLTVVGAGLVRTSLTARQVRKLRSATKS